MLKGKKIILGITGSIAAYKAAYIIRALVKKGAEVQVVITPGGKEFITPITLSALSSNPVISEFFSNRDGSWHSHVDLGLWADAMLIAPATASSIGKMANGIADNMLITTYLSCKAPVFIAPAMDLDMFAHPSTQQNIEKLRSFGNHIIEPGEGELASHLVGKGRMEEPDAIVGVLDRYFDGLGSLTQKKIVITAGPTYEKIDPVRFIGNYSSGKMGFALAEACAAQGAQVTLIAGPVSLSTTHPGIRRIDVESAEEMYQAAVRTFPDSDAAILCAAVADYRPEVQSDEKIKREKTGDITMHLVPNPDIAAALGKMKQAGQRLVGFALETTNEVAHATEKLERKNLDFIVLNSLKDKGAGFRCDTNKVSILEANGKLTEYPVKPKNEVAGDIVEKLASLLK
ncbi:bifunctional phosphopantothenoylcysteine decarboxylase/phosphopantothenate--cysteine ligase CoaBC [Macellibacteroides fermentans]|jgi:phosphopantothenoylcysteine decarboxylase/phosphopantothenate--cysteine ligase|uniref:Coenzyme A biosynthesis bifunctional protein CoaBC n=2 Tax=root TaxID=1 RepID=A0A8E2A1M4_9PORP|nr:bifunctional phosphopantothenoylcysteine decarboxylase/phosphopantothenate--cysteine ligase CoaBC [Macellibacteroides fermentans]MBP8026382.1 bifunctional phosphopantothenoylcysteine decarboxylase/phosphopantothenate--cysteine ligase CoaBC [Parabacteroides sp.]MDT3369089.1 bifunctional phosphopantothenoylcysteine decarboxylase/phosphopantothenate--cysteine ligase CoaBC [Bacteroidota bacterium]MEA4807932.1 bifunctional phosphopantothenoylcysteine decarboxylase/phosphopantothenate--cysteine lig